MMNTVVSDATVMQLNDMNECGLGVDTAAYWLAAQVLFFTPDEIILLCSCETEAEIIAQRIERCIQAIRPENLVTSSNAMVMTNSGTVYIIWDRPHVWPPAVKVLVSPLLLVDQITDSITQMFANRQDQSISLREFVVGMSDARFNHHF